MLRVPARIQFRLVTALLLATAVTFSSPPQVHRPSTAKDDPLKAFLKSYLRRKDPTTRFSVASVHLSGRDAFQAIVYVTGDAWCGSGGCLTLILTREGLSYRAVGRITITRPPIRVFESSSNGWRDVGVWVQGGGIQPGYEAKLHFDGRAYPSNPSIPPAQPSTTTAEGRTVLSSTDQGVLLYQ